VTFDDNKTPDNIYDDKIIDVKPWQKALHMV
jgi:hypothetical protein